MKPKRGPWLAKLENLKVFIAKVNTHKLKGILKDHGGNSTKHQKQNTKNQETSGDHFNLETVRQSQQVPQKQFQHCPKAPVLHGMSSAGRRSKLTHGS